ncbi:copper resistance CopC family protein [Longispora sp. NPDC051575]|uniref:copper resistance CopC family protein n=1 Tax=Longispora sp. NPDC051575 TaxID=3154943 RepID=UPI00343FB7F7
MTNLGTVRRLVLALAVGLVAAASVATPAWAHARLLSSTPTDGAAVTGTVAAVTLTFSDPLKEQFTTVVVTGSGGASHAEDTPQVRGTTVTQRVRALPAGQVRVAWRTVSQDGHPVEGAFTFTVTDGGTGPAGASPGAAGSSPDAKASPPVTAASPNSAAGGATSTVPVAGSSGGGARWPWLLGGGALLLVAAAGTLFWTRPGRA